MADKDRFNLRYKPILEPERTWRSEATFQHPVRHYTETIPADGTSSVSPGADQDQPFRTDSATDNSHELVSGLFELPTVRRKPLALAMGMNAHITGKRVWKRARSD